ncbi:hypothetical protein FB45DRAFT_30468 [Roridomyces roridus]|uniref:Uncharacterized protein n=1 Tax=Roridomyces roridus TaxID=1738132 RepID=A0AAD7CKL9_9AGAR|nr:hypothetical protein FB45DRAFT_30468 [Roridomyces roridus]
MTSRSHLPVTEKAGATSRPRIGRRNFYLPEKAGVSPQLIGQPMFPIFGQPLAGVYNKRCRALYPQVPDSHLLSCPSQRPSSPMVTAVGGNRSTRPGTTRHDINEDEQGDAAANPTPAPSQRSPGPLSISVWRKVPARMRRRRLPLLEGLVLPWLW